MRFTLFGVTGSVTAVSAIFQKLGVRNRAEARAAAARLELA